MSSTRDLIEPGTDCWVRWPLNHCLLKTQSRHYTPPLNSLCVHTKLFDTNVIYWCPHIHGVRKSRRSPQRNHFPLSGRNCLVVSLLTPIVVDQIYILTAEIPTLSIILSLHTSLFPQFPWKLRSCLSSLSSKEMRAPNVCDDFSAYVLCWL